MRCRLEVFSLVLTVLTGCLGSDVVPYAGEGEENIDRASNQGSRSGEGSKEGTLEAEKTTPLSAQLTENRATKTRELCRIDVTWLSVKLPSFEAQTKVNQLLNFDPFTALDAMDCSGPADETITGRYASTFNRDGVLSVSYVEHFVGMRDQKNITTYNFDLATGLVINLSDVLDATGRAELAKACKVTTSLKGDFSDECAQAVEPSSSGPPVYAIEAGGIRIHPIAVSNVNFDTVAVPGALASWSAFAGHITFDALKAQAP